MRPRRVRLGFGGRLVVQIAAAVAVAIVIAATITFFVVRGQLRAQVDDTLAERAEAARFVALRNGSNAPVAVAAADSHGALKVVPARLPGSTVKPLGGSRGVVAASGSVRIGRGRAELVPLGGQFPAEPAGRFEPALVLPPAALGGPDFLLQVVGRSGDSRAAKGKARRLSVLAEDVAVARGESSQLYSERDIDGTPVRVLTSRIAPGTALQIARPLGEVNSTVSDLLLVLVLVTVGGTVAAAILGVAVGRHAMRPIRELTATAESVAQTGNLARRIAETGDQDELDRLRTAFNRMLAELERSIDAQRDLVADASHELRTPLTSLRTNVELLDRAAGLPADERRRLLADVEAELLDLGRLVDDVVELAREGAEDAEPREVRLDQIVEIAVDRARRRASGLRFDVQLEATVIDGDGERLDRAISNLLENAIEWSPPGGLVEVTLAGGCLSVRDHGAGIAAADLGRVFDRFYRATAARSRPGSGLGLAIVRRVADQHGASADAVNPAGGGAMLRLAFRRWTAAAGAPDGSGANLVAS